MGTISRAAGLAVAVVVMLEAVTVKYRGDVPWLKWSLQY